MCCAPLHMAPHGQVALDSPTSMVQNSGHLTRAFHMGLSCTRHLCYPMTPTHRHLGPSPAGRPPMGCHPSTYRTLRMMVVLTVNLSLLLHLDPVPAGAIGPETPVAPSQSPRSHVKAWATLVSTADAWDAEDWTVQIWSQGGGKERDAATKKPGERQAQRDMKRQMQSEQTEIHL